MKLCTFMIDTACTTTLLQREINPTYMGHGLTYIAGFDDEAIWVDDNLYRSNPPTNIGSYPPP